jgi:hypothetical protein
MELFIDLLREIKKIIISIKNGIIRFISILVAMFYMLDGPSTNISEESKQFSIGSCFHPRTLIKLKSGDYCQMQNLPLGAELEDGGKVFAVLKVDNIKKEPLYVIDHLDDESLKRTYVTGEHFIHDIKDKKWIQVKNYRDAKLQTDVTSDWFSCLITTNHRIKIGQYTFWDWEDDELTSENKIHQE